MSDRLLPYDTIIKAHEGDPTAIQAVLDRYAGYIRYFSKMNGYYKNAPGTRSVKSVWRWIFKQSRLPVRGRDMNAGRRYLTLSRWPPLLLIYRTMA